MRSSAPQAIQEEAPESGAGDLAALARHCVPGTPSFVLIDPLAGEPIAIDVDELEVSFADLMAARAAAWGREVQAVALEARIDLSPRLSPYLVALTGSEDPWLAETLELAHVERLAAQADGLAGEGKAAHRVGTWLHSSAYPEQVAAAVSDALTLRSERGSGYRYQRLADRRVMRWAAHVSGAEQLGAALGPIERWTCMDATGQLRDVQRGKTQSSPWRWSATQLPMFLQGELVHQATARYLGELALRGLTQPGDESDLFTRAHSNLLHAQALARQWQGQADEAKDVTALTALLLLHGSQLVEAELLASTHGASVRMRRPTGQDRPGAAAQAAHSATALHELAPALNALLFEKCQ